MGFKVRVSCFRHACLWVKRIGARTPSRQRSAYPKTWAMRRVSGASGSHIIRMSRREVSF